LKTSRVKLNKVIDGDTVDVTIGRGFFKKAERSRIRLWGMDAPETSQKGGDEATKHLCRMIGGKTTITLEEMDRDQYGRIVGVIYPGKARPEKSYNYRMVKDGHAECYLLSGENTALYQQAEEEAKTKKINIWKDRNYQRPTDFRKQENAKQERKSRFLLKLKLTAAAVALAALALYLAGKYLGTW